MKYLKTYENLTNYQVEVLTREKFYELYNKIYPYDEDVEFDLKDKIHYFSYNDMQRSWSNDKHDETLRFIVAYNDKDILGICKFAYWSSSDGYAVSYLSTNTDYFHSGVSKKILEELFKYFSKTYPDEILNWSGYSIDGWKYLHKTILEMSDKYNVKLSEQPIHYPTQWDDTTKTFITNWSDENRELYNKSKEEINKKYNKNDTY
jgi:hypothetical protein